MVDWVSLLESEICTESTYSNLINFIIINNNNKIYNKTMKNKTVQVAEKGKENFVIWKNINTTIDSNRDSIL